MILPYDDQMQPYTHWALGIYQIKYTTGKHMEYLESTIRKHLIFWFAGTGFASTTKNIMALMRLSCVMLWMKKMEFAMSEINDRQNILQKCVIKKIA